MKVMYWILIALLLYAYIGYPLALLLLAKLKYKAIDKRDITPTVTVVIAVFNEEKCIGAKIQNLLSQQYPIDLLNMIIVSDGSTDNTNDIIETYNSKQLKTIVMDERHGKASAINEAIKYATGEIIVFADSRQFFAADAIKQLVCNFNDSTIGCVGGEMIFRNTSNSHNRVREMGIYWKYEKWIRFNESASGNVMGVSGAIYAARRNLLEPLPAGTLLDDVLIPLRIMVKGYRVILDSSAIAFDNISKDLGSEWKRKVRTMTGNWQLLFRHFNIIASMGCELSWRYFSHKILRLLVPFILIALLIDNIIINVGVYKISFVFQVIFYMCVFTGWIFAPARKLGFIRVIYFFIVMNLAVLVGLWKWICGKSQETWLSSSINS